MPRQILLAQFPAFFLLSVLFLLFYLRVRKRSAVKSMLWVLLFGIALAASLLLCFLGIQAELWTIETLFRLSVWSWLGVALVAAVLILITAFRLQRKRAKRLVEKERAKAEKSREEAVAKAREEARAEALHEAAASVGEAATDAEAPLSPAPDEVKQEGNDDASF